VIDDDDVARWQAEFERLDRGDVTLTLFMATFAATGRKPSYALSLGRSVCRWPGTR